MRRATATVTRHRSRASSTLTTFVIAAAPAAVKTTPIAVASVWLRLLTAFKLEWLDVRAQLASSATAPDHLLRLLETVPLEGSRVTLSCFPPRPRRHALCVLLQMAHYFDSQRVLRLLRDYAIDRRRGANGGRRVDDEWEVAREHERADEKQENEEEENDDDEEYCETVFKLCWQRHARAHSSVREDGDEERSGGASPRGNIRAERQNKPAADEDRAASQPSSPPPSPQQQQQQQLAQKRRRAVMPTLTRDAQRSVMAWLHQGATASSAAPAALRDSPDAVLAAIRTDHDHDHDHDDDEERDDEEEEQCIHIVTDEEACALARAMLLPTGTRRGDDEPDAVVYAASLHTASGVFRTLLYPRLAKLSAAASRTLLSCVLDTAKRHPRAAVDTLLLPLLLPPSPSSASSSPWRRQKRQRERSHAPARHALNSAKAEVCARLCRDALPGEVTLAALKQFLRRWSPSRVSRTMATENDDPAADVADAADAADADDDECTLRVLERMLDAKPGLDAESAAALARVLERRATAAGMRSAVPSLRFAKLLSVMVTRFPQCARQNRHTLRAALDRCAPSFLVKSARSRLAQLERRT